jgi:hypothetical protein
VNSRGEWGGQQHVALLGEIQVNISAIHKITHIGQWI